MQIRYSRKIILSLILLLFSFLFAGIHLSVAAKHHTPKILILHSYHRSLSWVESIEKGITREFKKNKAKAEFRFEYMDTKRIDRPDYLLSLFDMYKIKFKDIKFDLVICSDNNALNFLLLHHDVLFSGIPVVFCGINNFSDDMLSGRHLFTGVVEDVDFKSTIDVALKLSPNTRKIILYGDDSPTYHANKALMDKFIFQYKNRVKFQFKNNFNLEQILQDTRKLKPGTLIMLISTVRTKNGDLVSYVESSEMIESVSHVPIYGVWDFFLGHGIVGGKLTSGSAQGEAAADIALQILNGKQPADIPVVKTSPNRYMFDNNQLKKFHFDSSMLPENSIIINKPPSFYLKNIKLIVSTIGILLGLIFVIFILVFNIRGRKQLEKKLIESKKKYKSIFDNAVEGIFQSTPAGILIAVNPAFARIHGYSSPEDIISSINDMEKQLFVNPGDRHRYVKLLQDKGVVEHFEFKACRKDNSHIWVSVCARAVYDKNGNVICFEGNVTDITKRKQSEKQIARLATVVEQSGEEVVITDLKGNIEYVNPEFEKVTGYNFKEVKNKNPRILKSGEQDTGFYKNLWDTITSGKTWNGIFSNKKKDGTIFYERAIIFPVKDEKNNITGFAAAKQDITHEKILERQLQQSQKMESIGTLAGGIAHDFNNILFPIMGYTEMLIKDLPMDSPMQKSLDRIYAGALRAKNLVQQILTFSRQETCELKPVKIQNAVIEALKLIRASIPATINITQDIRTDCGMVRADPTQIHQIVMNLATNAWHAMKNTGGKLTISLKKIKLRKPEIYTIDSKIIPGDYVCLTIGDTGTGMDKTVLGKIFDPFFTTKQKGKGTGMGLSVVHGIVRNMGGGIKVETEPERGTEFKVYLPVVKSSVKEKFVENKDKLQGGTERILLVDDEEYIITMETEMLEKLGYQVTSSSSSINALEIFRASPNKVDMVITDMAMPNMSGDELSMQLIKIRPDIPILLCTGFSETMSEKQAISLGIKGFLFKPVLMNDLALKIRKILDNGHEADLDSGPDPSQRIKDSDKLWVEDA